jgi:hypothetical protein
MSTDSAERGPLIPEYLRPVLGQLLSGATDNAASHRLNMSARTFSRRVAELLDVLGVQTRFQAGFEIARRARQRSAQPVTAQSAPESVRSGSRTAPR